MNHSAQNQPTCCRGRHIYALRQIQIVRYVCKATTILLVNQSENVKQLTPKQRKETRLGSTRAFLYWNLSVALSFHTTSSNISLLTNCSRRHPSLSSHCRADRDHWDSPAYIQHATSHSCSSRHIDWTSIDRCLDHASWNAFHDCTRTNRRRSRWSCIGRDWACISFVRWLRKTIRSRRIEFDRRNLPCRCEDDIRLDWSRRGSSRFQARSLETNSRNLVCTTTTRRRNSTADWNHHDVGSLSIHLRRCPCHKEHETVSDWSEAWKWTFQERNRRWPCCTRLMILPDLVNVTGSFSCQVDFATINKGIFTCRTQSIAGDGTRTGSTWYCDACLVFRCTAHLSGWYGTWWNWSIGNQIWNRGWRKRREEYRLLR